MVLTSVSRILGFVRIAVITSIFGAGAKADIINLAFSIPNNLRKLLAEGALSSAFVPELSRAIVGNDTDRGKALVRSIIGFQLLVIVPICLLSIVAARPLMVGVLSEFKDPVQIEEAVRLFRYFINYLLLISVSAVLMGVLNSHQRFLAPAAAPILFSLGVIGSILLFNRRLDINSVAVGVLSGGLLQIAIQVPRFRRLGYRLQASFVFASPEFRKVLSMWGPILATSSLFAITNQIAVRFASGMDEGSVTSLSIAITFFQLPFGVFSASITTVLFPRMSRHSAEADLKGLRESLEFGLRFIAVLLIPSALFLCLSGRGLISVAFQRNDFDLARTLKTNQVLVAYAVGLFSVGAFTFVQRLFYALGKSRIPFYGSVLVAALDVVLMITFRSSGLGASGIALANSVSFTVGLLVLLLLTRRFVGRIDYVSLIRTLARTVAAIGPAAGSILLIRMFVGHWWLGGSSLSGLGMIVMEFLIFSAIVLAIYQLTGVEMVSMIFKRRKESK